MSLFHYCSNDSFVAIVKSRSLRLSELTLSNDYMEGKWVRNVFQQVCQDFDMSESHTEQLLNRVDRTIDFWAGLGFCMSARPDVLSQWRNYADDGTGISIGFSKDYLLEIKDQFGRDSVFHVIGLAEVIYDLNEQKKKLRPFVEYIAKLVKLGALDRAASILLSGDETERKKQEREEAQKNLIRAFAPFFLLLYSLKNPAFQEEVESRLVAWVPKHSVNGGDNKYLKELELYARGAHLVPYFELILPQTTRKAIDEVWLGPRNATPGKFVEAFLEKQGFSEVRVQRSAASYRK